MFVETWILLVIYIFACSALLIALWMFLTLEDMKANGKKWIDLNRTLLDKVERLESLSNYNRYKK